jgi:hypothetical protein
MMAIMLDSCFKALHIVENLVERRNAIQLASEYDVKVVVPFFMVCFDRLNPTTITSIATIDVTRLKLEENMFGVGV